MEDLRETLRESLDASGFFSIQRAKNYPVPKMVVRMKRDSGVKGLYIMPGT